MFLRGGGHVSTVPGNGKRRLNTESGRSRGVFLSFFGFRITKTKTHQNITRDATRDINMRDTVYIYNILYTHGDLHEVYNYEARVA